MPRFVKSTFKSRAEKADRTSLRGSRKWVDPFPAVHGTLPEKMVYAELTRLGIPFLFLNDLRFTLPDIGFDKYYQADFVLPDLRLIIEVQGSYWHSMEKTIEADAFKFAIYEMVGYKVLAWWDYDIISRLHDLIAAEPLLLSAANTVPRSTSTELPVQRREKQDTSKGIRTLNQKRFRGTSLQTGRRKIRKAVSSYGR